MPAHRVVHHRHFRLATGKDANPLLSQITDPNTGCSMAIFEGDQRRIQSPVPHLLFYAVSSIPAPGWSEISVDLGNYRYFVTAILKPTA